jgi:multidrug resistance efflux pump
VTESEEKLQRARADYKRAYGALLATIESNQDSELKRAYLEAHNAYVLQLRATNATAERYQFHCLPGLLGEVADIYEQLCTLTCNCIGSISENTVKKVSEQARRYQKLAKEAKLVNPQSDLQVGNLVRYLASS